MTAKQRIDFLDLARGWVIFLVVWVHTDHPFWVTAYFVNAFFFFLGGFFFKKLPWKDFMTKQVKGLLIPFLFFYLISYPFRMVLHFGDFRTLAGFDWACIFDLFDCASRSDYLFVNVPLWFILCIFVMWVYYWFICTWPRKLLGGIALALLAAGPFFQSLPSPFMLNNACYWLGFFMLGNLLGKRLIQHLSVKQHRFPFLAVTGIAGLACYALEPAVADFEGLLYVLTHVERMLLIVATLAFFSFEGVIKYYPPVSILRRKFVGGAGLSYPHFDSFFPLGVQDIRYT